MGTWIAVSRNLKGSTVRIDLADGPSEEIDWSHLRDHMATEYGAPWLGAALDCIRACPRGSLGDDYWMVEWWTEGPRERPRRMVHIWSQ